MKKPPKTAAYFARISIAALLSTAVLGFGTASIGAQEKKPDPRPASPAQEASGIAQYDNGVAAVVNEIPISDYDLRQRMALVISTSGVQQTPDLLKKIRTQVLEQLETENLQLQEARRKNITVSPAEVDKDIDNILRDNHLTSDQLKTVLSQAGVVMATLRSQIAVQIAWQKAVEDEYQDRINITPADVDEELARIAEGASKPHFAVAEIFFGVDSPDQDAKVLKDAQNVENQLQLGAPFAAMARQFSQSPSAAAGGDIGVVYDGQLAPELNAALEKLSPGGVSEPIRSNGGYYILGLRERQEAAGTKLPDPATQQKTSSPGVLPLARVLLPLPPKAPQAYIEAAFKGAAAIRQHIANCAQLPKMIAEIKGAVYMNLGDMKLTDLSQQMQSELAKTQPGETTAPFASPAGIELIVRCDKGTPRLTAFSMPSRDVVERQLFEQQISMLARRYIRDLRRDADVEVR